MKKASASDSLNIQKERYLARHARAEHGQELTRRAGSGGPQPVRCQGCCCSRCRWGGSWGVQRPASAKWEGVELKPSQPLSLNQPPHQNPSKPRLALTQGKNVWFPPFITPVVCVERNRARAGCLIPHESTKHQMQHPTYSLIEHLLCVCRASSFTRCSAAHDRI
jgi:hypothetical protein